MNNSPNEKYPQRIKLFFYRSIQRRISTFPYMFVLIDFNSLSQNPLSCTCPGSELLYALCGNVVKGYLSIMQNEKLRYLVLKLSRSLFLHFNYLVSVTAGGPVSPQGHM